MRQFHFPTSVVPETTATLYLGKDDLRWLEAFLTNLNVSVRATVPTPVNTTDAATKAYVDGLFNPVLATIVTADGSVSITNATTLRLDQADGLVLTNPSAGVARLDLAAIPNSVLANSSLTVTAGTGLSGGGAVSLGGSVTVTLSTHDHQGAGAQGGTLDAAAIASGTLAVARGGTNLGSGTSGGILGYTAAGVLASSVVLTANAIVLGGGAGATPTPMTGTSGGVVYFNAATTVASSGLLTAKAVLKGGGAGAAPTSLTDPGADRLIFWDESANDTVYLTPGSTLTITDTTIDVTTPAAAAATQAEQETATSTTVYVSPGRQQFHPSGAKGWVNHDGAAIVVSYNVTSVTDTGTGDWTINWDTDFSSGNYAPVPGVRDTNALGRFIKVNSVAGGTTQIQCYTDNSGAGTALVDPNNWYCVAYGDQ